MTRQVFSSGETPSYTKLNNVSDQTVIICTSSTHPSSPIAGMRIFETDTKFTKVYDGSGWETEYTGLLDSIGGGINTGPPITGTTVDVNGSDFTVAVVAGQKYRYSGNLAVSSDATATDFVFNVNYDGSNLTREDRYVTCDVVSRLYDVTWQTIVTPGASGTKTIKMNVARSSGGGNGTVYARDIIFEHMGDPR